MGAWLKVYGQSIYGTRGGPFKPSLWGVSTRKDNIVYLHILDWDMIDDCIQLPVIEGKIIGASLLADKGTVDFDRREDVILLNVPVPDRNEIDTVVALKLDTSATDIEPVVVPSGSLARGKRVKGSSVYENDPAYGPQLAIDDNDSTRWVTEGGATSAWLEVDLGKPVEFNKAMIHESENSIVEFELQYKLGDDWKTIVRGERVKKSKLEFDPVNARHVRLNISKKSKRTLELHEFQLFAPK
jgi:alpha-L-fucosidase